MKLFLISQDVNDGYDSFDSAVVVAKSEQDAREIHPSSFVTHVTDERFMGTYAKGLGGEYLRDYSHDWVPFRDIENVKVKEIGLAHPSMERGVVCASFNAG